MLDSSIRISATVSLQKFQKNVFRKSEAVEIIVIIYNGTMEKCFFKSRLNGYFFNLNFNL